MIVKFKTQYSYLMWLVLFVATLHAPATQFVPLSVEQLVEYSQIVLRGTVVSKTCQRDAEGRIFTKVELHVIEVWKGPVTNHCTIVQSGGTVGDECALVPGQAVYSVGEEVVVFLALNERGEGVTLGLAHGKFKVWKDEAGEQTVQNIFHGRAPAGEKAGFLPSAGQPKPRLPLAELKRQVQGTRP